MQWSMLAMFRCVYSKSTPGLNKGTCSSK
uniref:Uncharacterized protein n=1 Tax=Anguilla anguilla TaxID=7936 RepID=A0A0E9XNS2_ANGAN